MDPASREDTEPNYKVISLVQASPALWAVLQALVANPRGLSQRAISQVARVSQGHMSEHLGKLAEFDLVKCNDPSVRKGKTYAPTMAGNQVALEVQRIKNLEQERTSGGMQIGSKGPV